MSISIGRRRVVTAALLLGTFLSSIEVTVVGAAMPSIVGQLGGLALYPWVFSAYLLSQTISIPLYGRLADLYGRRSTYVSGVALFVVGSIACGSASTMEALVASRALQGLGAGVVLPLTMTIFGDLYEIEQRTKLQGLFSLVWGISAVAGPLAGGLIVANASWRWVFLLNIPFGVVSVAAVLAFLPEVVERGRPTLDLVGAMLLCSATMSLLLALLPANQRPLIASPLPYIALSVTSLVGLVYVESRHREPLIPLKLFRDRVHLAANVTGVLLGVVLFGMISYIPLYMQGVLGATPLEAGAALIPLSLGWSTGAIVGGRVLKRIGFAALVRVGCGLVSLGTLLAVTSPLWAWHLVALGGLIAYGLGMGACISTFTVAVQERVETAQRGIATALTQFSRSIGGAVGVAVLGAVLATATTGELELGASREQLALGLRRVFMVAASVAMLASIVGASLFPSTVSRSSSDLPAGEEK